MKFKIGDKVMLKAVPHLDFNSVNSARAFYDMNEKRTFKVTNKLKADVLVLDKFNMIRTAYLKHAVKPKPVMYTIDCRRMSCSKDCPERINGDVKICEFISTKSQVEAHMKKYWKHPKIKAVVK